MKILLRYCGLNARAVWRGLVESQIKKLQGLAAIASARVTLERQCEFAPAFRVQAQLEVPGPDFHNRWKTNVRLGLLPGQGALGYCKA
jgi:hypothetical protein